MSLIRIRSGAEQVADHLREEIRGGRWMETVPGVHQLADECGVNHKTVKAALGILEKEQLVIPQGPGRKRRIDLSKTSPISHPLRLAILAADPESKRNEYMLKLHHELVTAGHEAFFAPGSLDEMKMNLRRTIRLVEQTPADAWLISGGPRDVLDWFSKQELPAFALFGRRRGMPIASIGPDKAKATTRITRRLAELGHRRIILMTRKFRRLPEPGAGERAFLRELEAQGITPSSYHLPDWEETPAGLRACLKSLFQFTPPTALILDEPPFLIGALQFLGQIHIRVPEDVSLIATDPDPSFQWCDPSIAHLRWESRPWIRRIVRWANNVRNGKEDRRQSFTKAELVEGGTIGPVNPQAVEATG